jgi:hypothetical protein
MVMEPEPEYSPRVDLSTSQVTFLNDHFFPNIIDLHILYVQNILLNARIIFLQEQNIVINICLCNLYVK